MPIGTWELIVIFLAVLLLFGGKKIPEIARGLGKGIREFKRAASDVQRELDLDRLDDDIIKKPHSDIPDKTLDTSKEVAPSATENAGTTPEPRTGATPELPGSAHDPGPEVESEERAKQSKESPGPAPKNGGS